MWHWQNGHRGKQKKLHYHKYLWHFTPFHLLHGSVSGDGKCSMCLYGTFVSLPVPPFPALLQQASLASIISMLFAYICLILLISLHSLAFRGMSLTHAPLHTQGRPNSYTCHPDFGRGHKWACQSGHRASASPIPGYPFLSVPLAVNSPKPRSSNKESLSPAHR